MESLLFFIFGAAAGVAIMWVATKRNKQLAADFENIANRVLEERTNKADTQISTQLAPFRRDLEYLQKSIIDASKEKHSLMEQIERIGTQANSLADALTSRPQMRGNWGEILLQKMLGDSGLREGTDYQLQANLTNDEGDRLRPDVVLHLPEKKHLVIDSKLSLVSYKKFLESKEPADWKEFERATKSHIDDLARKSYPHAHGIEAPDFTLMFMPIEGAFVHLMQEKSSLQTYAWDKKVILASPSLLFAMLQTVSSLWQLDKQNKNSDEIARMGGALYDKVVDFDEDMKKLGKQIETASKTFDDTHKRLSSGRGNILSRTQKLQEMGAKTSKQLPQLDREEEDER